MSVPFYPFNSLPLKLLNKGMGFPFPLLFFSFISIPLPPPKKGLRPSPLSPCVCYKYLVFLKKNRTNNHYYL